MDHTSPPDHIRGEDAWTDQKSGEEVSAVTSHKSSFPLFCCSTQRLNTKFWHKDFSKKWHFLCLKLNTSILCTDSFFLYGIFICWGYEFHISGGDSLRIFIMTVLLFRNQWSESSPPLQRARFLSRLWRRTQVFRHEGPPLKSVSLRRSKYRSRRTAKDLAIWGASCHQLGTLLNTRDERASIPILQNPLLRLSSQTQLANISDRGIT